MTPPALRSEANGIINMMGGVGTMVAFLAGRYLFSMGKAIPFLKGCAIQKLPQPQSFHEGEEPMNLQFFIDLFLHPDRYIGPLFSEHAVLTCGLVFLILFCETGLVSKMKKTRLIR